MDKLERAYQLDKLLKHRRSPVSMAELCELFECSESTTKRTIEEMRNLLGAPILNTPAQGYFYSRNSSFEMPGVWFSAGELYALLTMQRLSSNLSGGFMATELAGLQQKIETVLRKAVAADPAEFKRIRVLDAGKRSKALPFFPALASAVLQRQRLQIEYSGRGRSEQSNREISPQRLTHYRGNWYLDAWCHKADGLRTFAVERINQATVIQTPCLGVDDAELDRQVASSFGIFAGEPTDVAILRFNPKSAAWVADEQWFPDIEGEWLADGYFELRIPYNNPTELILEICRHGPDVEVVEPLELRERVAERLQQAAAQYARKVNI